MFPSNTWSNFSVHWLLIIQCTQLFCFKTAEYSKSVCPVSKIKIISYTYNTLYYIIKLWKWILFKHFPETNLTVFLTPQTTFPRRKKSDKVLKLHFPGEKKIWLYSAVLKQKSCVHCIIRSQWTEKLNHVLLGNIAKRCFVTLMYKPYSASFFSFKKYN